MAGILGYLSVLADDISTLAGKTVATASKSLATSLDDVGILFDDIVTYTKLAGVKSSGILVDDLAAISSFTNETTSDILKKRTWKSKLSRRVKTKYQKFRWKISTRDFKWIRKKIKTEAIKKKHRKVQQIENFQ